MAPSRAAGRGGAGNAAAVGFSVHTGWAVAVVAAGPAAQARPLLRRRIELCAGPAARFVYHAAAKLDDLAAAQRLVEAARAEAMEHAGVAMRSLQAALPAGHRLLTAGFVQSSARLPDSLEAILRAHPLLHTAEGVLFRKVLAQACGDLRLPVLGVPSRELGAAAAALLGLDPGELQVWLAAAGRELGRPWGKDEKDALQVATLALAAAPR